MINKVSLTIIGRKHSKSLSINKVARDYFQTSKDIRLSLQNKYRLEEPQNQPGFSLVSSENQVEFTLYNIMDYKK